MSFLNIRLFCIVFSCLLILSNSRSIAQTEEAPQAGEFSFSPMVSSIYLASGTKQTFKLSNPGEQKIEVKLSVLERVPSGDGESRFSTKVARLSRNQVNIPARGEATVDFEYTGSKKIPLERAFRLIAKGEVMSEGVRLARTYEASVHVLLPQHSVDLKVVSIKPSSKPSTGENSILLIENLGTASAEMSRYRFEALRDNKWVLLMLDNASIEKLAKMRIFPKTQREVNVRFLQASSAQLSESQLRLTFVSAD